MDFALKPCQTNVDYCCCEKFQSLFWWILLLNRFILLIAGRRFGFQSLFWWILLLNISRALLDGFSTAVSILVLVDFALKRVIRTGFNTCPCLFQSLFWWILLLNPVLHFLTETGKHLVSILVLVDFALKHRPENSFRHTIRVSILVLVDFALKPK